jgi:hypothetical protein
VIFTFFCRPLQFGVLRINHRRVCRNTGPPPCAGASTQRLDSDFPSRYQINGLIEDPMGSSGPNLKKREE